MTTEGTTNDANGNLTFAYDSQVLRYSPAQVAGTESTTTPTVFISQPTPLPESFGFVSLLGLAFAPNNDILVSDFAGGIRRYNSDGVLVNTISTNYTGTSPSNNFIGGLTFGAGSSSSFTGSQFTNSSLVRSIGITAVPVPENFSMIGGLFALSAFSVAAGKKRRGKLS